MNTKVDFFNIQAELSQVIAHAGTGKFDEDKAKKCIETILNKLKVFTQPLKQITDKKTFADIQVSIQTLEKSATDAALKTKLAKLLSKIDHISKYGIIKEKFKAESTASTFEILQSSIKALFRFLSGRIADEIHKSIYLGWSEKVKNENLKESIRNQLETKYNAWYEQKIAEAKNTQEREKIDQRILAEMQGIDTQLDKDQKIRKIEEIQKKGEATRAQMMEIGGKRIEIETSDGVKLDATYLSAEKFLKKFHKCNGQSVTLTLENNKTIKGVSFLTTQSNLSQLLQDLNLVSTQRKGGAGYGLVQNPNNPAEVFLIEEQQLDLNRNSFVNKKGNPSINSEGRYAFQVQVDTHYEKLQKTFSNENGAAILTSGNMGVYEMHKGEAMALLMRGVDAMLFNLRGYGQSEGEPTIDGSYLDIEAVYQYIKKERNGLADSKIVAWSMCLSGGIGAYLVEKHPEMNLFLNQTYASMASVIKKPILEMFKKKLGENSFIKNFLSHALTEIIYFVFRMIAPDYKVASRLHHIKGHVCTIQALSDNIMGQQETEEMTRVLKSHSVQHTPVLIPGQHSSNWTQVSVPEIQITLTKQQKIIRAGIQDYLKVKVDQTPYYVAKKLVNREKGVTINKICFKRSSKEKPYEIFVTKGDAKITKVKAKELEVEDSQDFISRLTDSDSVKNSYEYNWLGHQKINTFLENADLSRPLIKF